MVAPFVVILASLQLAVPVRCYQDPAAWDAAKIAVNTSPAAIAFYSPRAAGDPYVALSPRVCRETRRATATAALVLAHEFAHYRQDIEGRLADYETNRVALEAEADRVAAATYPSWQRRLRRLFRVAPPPPPVRLAP